MVLVAAPDKRFNNSLADTIGARGTDAGPGEDDLVSSDPEPW